MNSEWGMVEGRLSEAGAGRGRELMFFLGRLYNAVMEYKGFYPTGTLRRNAVNAPKLGFYTA